MKTKWSILLGVLTFGLTLTSCGNSEKKKAEEQLVMAQEAFQLGNYNEAKQLIDSIKILYPKAYDTRREGIGLMQQVELAEQQQTLHFLDSLQSVTQEGINKIVGDFKLEKDTVYQQVGNYFWPTQVVERNLDRSYLRFQVSELGVMSMTSIYNGSNSIHHHAVKVTAPDGTFAQTPMSRDSYETTNLGRKIEQNDYKLGEDGDVIGFISYNKDNNIKVEYIGDRKYNTTMSADDRKAAANVYELAQLLAASQKIKAEQEEANQKIQFIERKMAERSDKAVE